QTPRRGAQRSAVRGHATCIPVQSRKGSGERPCKGGRMNSWRGLALSLLVCGIAACGGGGSSPAPAPTPPAPPNPNPPAPTNVAPTVANDNYGASRDAALSVAAPG